MTRYSLLLLGGLIALQASMSHAAVSAAFKKEHERAVSLAHEDKPHQAITILNKLLKQDPGNKEVYQDLIIFTAWTGDCDGAIKLYKKIENLSKPNPWMIGPVAECMAKDESQQENALRLVQQNLSREPEHEELLNVQKQLSENIRLSRMHLLELNLNTSNTDQGTLNQQNVNGREWHFTAKYTHYISPFTKIYGRSHTVRSDEPGIPTADLNRIGIGIQQKLSRQFAITQEFSMDTERDGEEASVTTLYYFPNRFWMFNVAYASFAEDLPLRALGSNDPQYNNFEGSKFSANSEYHTTDYSIFWLTSLSSADYSDGNKPLSAFSEVEYRFNEGNRMEHYAVGEVSYSDNKVITGAPYFNPDDSLQLDAGYRLDYDYKTGFRNHIDKLFVYAGMFQQAGFSTKAIYGMRFKQEYEFTKRSSLSWGAELKSAVYDGIRESQVAFTLVYKQKI